MCLRQHRYKECAVVANSSSSNDEDEDFDERAWRNDPNVQMLYGKQATDVKRRFEECLLDQKASTY